MVQVLPSVPGFGEQLANVLGGALGDVGQGLLQRGLNRRDQSILNQFGTNPNLTPLQQFQMFGSLSPGMQQRIGPLLPHVMEHQGRQQAAQMEAVSGKEEIGTTINDIVNELEKGHSGLLNYYNKFTAKGRQSRAYIDEKSLGIEKKLADMVGKGALSKARFDYMVGKLPSSNASDATNRGRLKALSEEFKVEIKNPKFRSAFQEASAPSATVKVIAPSGNVVDIPEDQLEAALASGGRRA